MKVQQELYSVEGWRIVKPRSGINPNLILCFGSREHLMKKSWLDNYRLRYPNANVVSVSTSGEVSNQEFSENTIVSNLIEMEKATSVLVYDNIKSHRNDAEAATALAARIPKEGLRFILLFADGIMVNGSDLVSAFSKAFNDTIPISGGLAGDGDKFYETVLGVNENIEKGGIIAIGFYGDKLKYSCGCSGGWSHFGPTRIITKSEKNVLFDLDDQNALDLYKKYLGDFGENLAASALHFPLSLVEEGKQPVVRTVLSIHEKNRTMTFAGNMPEGIKVRFMKTTHQNLIDAASDAAKQSVSNASTSGDKLSLLISCVGRKFMMGSRIDDEIDSVRKNIGSASVLSGFYSHGEIAPHTNYQQCSLHNQTITITTLSEEI